MAGPQDGGFRMSIKYELDREEPLAQAYARLIWITNEKRIGLGKLWVRSMQRAKTVGVVSAIASLLSATTLATLISKLVPEPILAGVALALALIGGILAIIGAAAYNSRELLNIHLGASKFLELREALATAMQSPMSFQTRQERFEQLNEKYVELSQSYDHYVKEKEPPTTPILDIGFRVARKQIGANVVDKHQKQMFAEASRFMEQIREEDG
jgi:hypothetical protein